MKKLDGRELLKVEVAVPIDYILKLAGDDTGDVLDRRTTFGWKFEYLDQTFGDYISIIEEIKDDKLCRLPMEEMQEIKELLKEQATDVLLHRALLINSSGDYLKSEIDHRLQEKYYPVCLDSGKTYALIGEDGSRVYYKKLRIKYLIMVSRYKFVKAVSNLLFKLLG